MTRTFSAYFVAFLLWSVAVSVRAGDVPGSPATPNSSAQTFEQALYKGVIGNVLDALPIDPAKRVDLQRTNAVVSNTLTGRSLSMLVGLSNPVLMIGGLVWGMWAAANINPAPSVVKAGPTYVDYSQAIAMNDYSGGISSNSPPRRISVTDTVPTVATVASDSTVENAAREAPHSPVIRVWLPQRSTDEPVLARYR